MSMKLTQETLREAITAIVTQGAAGAEAWPVVATPFAALAEVGLTELIDKDDQVDQDDFSASKALALGGTYSGELLSVVLVSTELGTGTVLTPAGTLILFDANPTITAGDTALSVAEWQSVIGSVAIAAADWVGGVTQGGAEVFKAIAIPFHALATIYAVWFHTDAAGFNDAAGDDEELHINLWYRRDS